MLHTCEKREELSVCLAILLYFQLLGRFLVFCFLAFVVSWCLVCFCCSLLFDFFHINMLLMGMIVCVCFIKRYCWVVVLPPPSNHIKAVVMLCFVPSTLPSWKRCVDLCFISRNYYCGLSLTFVRMKTIFYFWGFL